MGIRGLLGKRILNLEGGKGKKTKREYKTIMIIITYIYLYFKCVWAGFGYQK